MGKDTKRGLADLVVNLGLGHPHDATAAYAISIAEAFQSIQRSFSWVGRLNAASGWQNLIPIAGPVISAYRAMTYSADQAASSDQNFLASLRSARDALRNPAGSGPPVGLPRILLPVRG